MLLPMKQSHKIHLWLALVVLPLLLISASDILESESLHLPSETTFVDSLLTVLPMVLTEEEQHFLAATPAHPAGLYAFYASVVAGNLVEHLWNFAWPSAIRLLHPSLLPMLAIIVGDPLVGKLMDYSSKVPAYVSLNVVQAPAQLLSATMIIRAQTATITSASSILRRPWFILLVIAAAVERLWLIVLVIAAAVERLCGGASRVAMELDLVVLLAGINRPIVLAQANAVLNRIDLLCEVLSRLGSQILQTGSHHQSKPYLGVVIIANDVSHFGVLTMLSLLSVAGASWMFYRWLFNPTDEQKKMLLKPPW